MKTIITLLALTLCSLSVAKIKTLDIAVEMASLKAEYFETSNRGIISVYGCNQCKKKSYEFTEKPKITKNGKPVSLDFFLKDYRNAKFPTLLLNKTDSSVLKIIY